MITLAMIAAVVFFVWVVVFVLRVPLLLACVACVLVGATLGPGFWHLDVGGITVTVDRLAFVGLAVAYAVRRSLGDTDPKPIAAADIVFFLLLGVITLSAAIYNSSDSQLGGMSPLWRAAVGYGIPVMVYWCARQSLINQRLLYGLYGMLACYGVYLTAIGIAEVSGQWSLVFPRFIADPELGIHFGRARGPMLQAVTYGMYVSVCLLSLGLLWPKLPRTAQLAAFVVAPLMGLAVYFSYTRSVWLGLGMATLVFFGLALEGRLRRVVVGGLVTAALLLGVMRADTLIGLEREHSASASRQSAEMRLSFAYVSWEMFLDHPWLGVGFGQFAHEKQPYLADRSTELSLGVLHSLSHHNTFLSLLTEVGVVGMGLFVALLGCWARASWRLWRCASAPDWARSHAILALATLMIYASQLTFYEVTFTHMENALVCLILGISMGLYVRFARSQPVSKTAGVAEVVNLATRQPQPVS